MSEPGINDAIDYTTREFCQKCGRLSRIGFWVPDAIWRAVTGRWAEDVLCLPCFAELGDEKFIQWEYGIKFYPVSYVAHHTSRGLGDG